MGEKGIEKGLAFLQRYNKFLIQYWITGLTSILPFYFISKNWSNLPLLLVFTILWFAMILLLCISINILAFSWRTKIYPLPKKCFTTIAFVSCFDSKRS